MFIHSQGARKVSISDTKWASVHPLTGSHKWRTGSQRLLTSDVRTMSCGPFISAKGLFTFWALDNLDHNPISLDWRQFISVGKLISIPVREYHPSQYPSSGGRRTTLSDYYSTVPAVVPECNIVSYGSNMDSGKGEEYRWVNHALSFLKKEE